MLLQQSKNALLFLKGCKEAKGARVQGRTLVQRTVRDLVVGQVHPFMRDGVEKPDLHQRFYKESLTAPDELQPHTRPHGVFRNREFNVSQTDRLPLCGSRRAPMMSQHAFKGTSSNARLKVITEVLIAVTAYGVMKDRSVPKGSKCTR